jgi:hypothetical protein
MSKNIYLDTITKDFTLTEEKNLKLTSTLTEFVSQKIENVILFFKEEWFLDFEKGIPYFEKIFTKNPDINLINTIFLREIRNISEIEKILKFDTTYDARERTFTIDLEVLANDGTVIENTFTV